jgi:hypothetical protein
LETSTMKGRRSLCFLSLLTRYSSTKAGNPSGVAGVPRMLTPSLSG